MESSVMSNKRLEKQFQRKMQQQVLENDIAANQNRARSVTVGTAFGGTIELMMRKHDGNVVWATLQPVEVIELLHQLSAGVGCQLYLHPREDFASWRDWKTETPEEIRHLNGHPPFASDINPHELRARMLPKPENQPGMQPALMNLPETEELQLPLNLNNRNSINEETLAVKKLNNKRTAK
jgi:hypothetical protein